VPRRQTREVPSPKVRTALARRPDQTGTRLKEPEAAGEPNPRYAVLGAAADMSLGDSATNAIAADAASVGRGIAHATLLGAPVPLSEGELHDRRLPSDENLRTTVGAVLTDSGREFCGKPESHPNELLLAVEASSTSRRRSARRPPTASSSA
jgi:hypothetical protein